MTEHDQHSSPIKSPKQLVIVVVLAFAIPIALIALITQVITGNPDKSTGNDNHVLARIQAFGTVALADASQPKGAQTGEQVYNSICKACHEGGLAGAPKTGDKAAWGPRIAQGQATLFQHAIAGYQGKAGVMPAKGGNADLTDTEVQRAVVYLANQAGGTLKEPAAPAAAPPAAAAAAPAAAAPAAAAPAAAAPAAAAPAAAAPAVAAAAGGKADGKKTYDTVCMVCHAAGVAGAPKFGDKAAWTPRIAQGNDTLYKHAIGGYQGKAGVMPAKGGNTSLSDADVKAAVDYMVSAAK